MLDFYIISLKQLPERLFESITSLKIFRSVLGSIFIFFSFINQFFFTKKTVYYRFNLGKVLHALEEFEAAADCFETALEVEAHSPILSVSTIPVTFE